MGNLISLALCRTDRLCSDTGIYFMHGGLDMKQMCRKGNYVKLKVTIMQTFWLRKK